MTVSLLVNNRMNSPQLSRSNERGISTHRYSPFGAGQLADAADSMPGFNGQRRDPVSHSYHLGNGYRAYNPILMRFNCPDSLSPFGAGGINSYAYCSGDPINRTDPSGHISWQAGVGIGLGILGIIATAGAASIAISAAGGIGAALSAASTTSLLTGSVGLAVDAVGIASGVISETNPELAATLGWVSMGAGLLGMAGGIKTIIGKSAIKKTNRNVKVNLNPENANPTKFIKGTELNIIRSKRNGKIQDVYTFGFVSDFNKTGEPALIIHGDKSHHLWINEMRFDNLAGVVAHLNKKHGIDLFSLPKGKRLHLASCYGGGEQGTAQRLATFLDYPVVGYGDNQILRTTFANEYLLRDTGYPRINPFTRAKNKTFYPKREGLSIEDLWGL